MPPYTHDSLTEKIKRIEEVVLKSLPSNLDEAGFLQLEGYRRDLILQKLPSLISDISDLEEHREQISKELKRLHTENNKLRRSRNALLILVGIACAIALMFPEAIGIDRQTGFWFTVAVTLYYWWFHSS